MDYTLLLLSNNPNSCYTTAQSHSLGGFLRLERRLLNYSLFPVYMQILICRPAQQLHRCCSTRSDIRQKTDVSVSKSWTQPLRLVGLHASVCCYVCWTCKSSASPAALSSCGPAAEGRSRPSLSSLQMEGRGERQDSGPLVTGLG